MDESMSVNHAIYALEKIGHQDLADKLSTLLAACADIGWIAKVRITLDAEKTSIALTLNEADQTVGPLLQGLHITS